MRVGIVRSDIGPIYLSDVENSSQRNFSSEPAGQSRYFTRPTDAQLTSALVAGNARVSVRGTNTAATVDTTTNDTLRIRTSASASFTVIAVTSGAATAKGSIVTDLNTAFAANSILALAKLVGTNQIQIEGTVAGPTAYLEIDSVANGSNLSTPLGYASGGVILNGLTAAGLRAAVQPSSTSLDVSSATIVALGATPDVANGDFSNLTTAEQAAIVSAIADVVAPTVIETGRALLSFDRGVLSQLRSASFRPGGARSGLPAGIGAAILDDDGSTTFTI